MFTLNFQTINSKFIVIVRQEFMGNYANIRQDFLKEIRLYFSIRPNEILEQINEIVKKSKYTEIMSSYNIIKKEIEVAQKKEKKLKEQIEQSLKTGVDIL
jgi:hypothetical protein